MSHSYIKLLKALCKSLQGIASQPQQPPLALERQPEWCVLGVLSVLPAFVKCCCEASAPHGKVACQSINSFSHLKRGGESSPAAEKLTANPNTSTPPKKV